MQSLPIRVFMCALMTTSYPNVRYGIILIVIAEVIFAFAWAAIKTVGARLAPFEVVFFRAILSLLILIVFMLWRGNTFKGNNYKLLFLRGILGFLGMIASFTAMIKMNLGNASILLNTFPLFVAIFAPLFIGERFLRINFVFVLISFAGIIMILKPTSDIFHNVALLGLTSGILIALSVVCVKRLSLTDSSSVITFYFTLITAIVSFPFAARVFLWPTPFEWLLLIWIAFAVTAGQLMMVKAFRYARAATISPFAYVSVLCSYLLGIVLWHDIPDMLSLAGGALIIVAGVAITMSEGRVKPVIPT